MWHLPNPRQDHPGHGAAMVAGGLCASDFGELCSGNNAGSRGEAKGFGLSKTWEGKYVSGFGFESLLDPPGLALLKFKLCPWGNSQFPSTQVKLGLAGAQVVSLLRGVLGTAVTLSHAFWVSPRWSGMALLRGNSPAGMATGSATDIPDSPGRVTSPL